MIAAVLDACAKHRWFVLLATALAAIAGAVAVSHAKLDAIPDLSEPQVIVFSEWMGRSPPLVEDQVTYPIVAGLVSAPRVRDVRGYSMFGMSFVYVVFEDDTDLYWARSRVSEFLATVRAKLPEGVNPSLGPDATGIGWAFQYVLTDHSGQHGVEQLRSLQDFTLRYAIGSVPGVAEVATVGGYLKQYQLQVDPDRLVALGVTVDEVARAVRDSNNDAGGRVIEAAGREYAIRGLGYVRDLQGIERIVLRAQGPHGTPILIRDVATVRFGPEMRRGALDWNGQGETVGAIVVVRWGENAYRVIERVKEKLAEVEKSLPSGVKIEVAYDRSDLIRRSIETLLHALGEEALTVSFVILLFLLHLRSSMLPIASLPIAVLLAFIPMVLLDIPSTIMSLGGIAIAIGATVDAEIVMIEACHKKLETPHASQDRPRMLREAAREVTPAIFFSLLIIAVAFLPVFTLTGQAGRLFRPLALTKTFVMLASALLSITFAPALRDLLLRGRVRPESKHPLSRLIVAVYKPFVFVALRNPRSTLLIGLFALVSAVPLWMSLGSEFMPPLNEGDALYMPITFPNISIEQARLQLQMQDRVLRDVPEVLSVFGKVGRAETATDPAPLTMVETTIRLKPQAQWRHVAVQRWWSGRAPSAVVPLLQRVWPESQPMSWDALTAEMNAKLQLPGWTNAWTMPIKTRIDMLSTGIRTPVGIKIQGADLQAIENVGMELESVLGKVRGTRSVLYERNLGGLYIDIVPDRERLARHGLTIGDVNRLIETAIGGAPIATTVEGRARYSVAVRLPQDLRANAERLRRISLPSRSSAPSEPAPATMGAMNAAEPLTAAPARAFVLLGDVADVQVSSGPPMVRDEGGLLTGYVYVDFDPAARDLGGFLADAQAAVDVARKSGQLKVPAGTLLRWTGQYEQWTELHDRLKLALPLTLALIVLLLWLHFRNLAEVCIVLLSVPFALVGSVWLLWALDYRMSAAVWVGIIALVGLATQTGIVMILYIDQAYERRRAAGKIRDLNDIIWAHMEGTVLRVRPKLMTVATMLAGLVPLLWATGSGADVMKRVAVPMVGGLLTSAFLTLELIPVVYTYWRNEQLLWQHAQIAEPRVFGHLQFWRAVQVAGWLGVAATGVASAYVELPATTVSRAVGLAGAVAVAGALGYWLARRGARRLTHPAVAG